MGLRKFSIALVGIFLTSTVVEAATVIVIQGNNSQFGRRFFCGFSSSATERISAFQYESKKEDALVARVKRIAPDLVFTLGEVPLPKLIPLIPNTPFLVGEYH